MTRNIKISINSSRIVRVVKYRRKQQTGKTRIAYRFLVEKPLQNKQLEDQERR
jgi:hypothetical protein